MPELVPVILEPVTVPVAATLVGVIAPRPTVIEPLLVTGPPVEVTPFAPVIPIEVTVPLVTVPLLAAVTLPNSSTVIAALVYEPAEVCTGNSTLIVPLVVIGLPVTPSVFEVILTFVTVPSDGDVPLLAAITRPY